MRALTTVVIALTKNQRCDVEFDGIVRLADGFVMCYIPFIKMYISIKKI